MRRVIEKSINLEPFPKKQHKTGVVIEWDKAIGIETDFVFDGVSHTLKILDRTNRDNCLALIDGHREEVVSNYNLRNAKFYFNDLRGARHRFRVGEIVNNCKILELTYEDRGTISYKVECVVDGYIFSILEHSLLRNRGCPVCTNNVVVSGINDVATTHPHLLPYFKNQEDAHTHTYASGKRCEMVCPDCGRIRMMTISKLSSRGFTCPYCSDGFSYPNKYAHCMFSQIQSQLSIYKDEWNPSWAYNYRYDNYLEFGDGQRLIVEVDGGLHFRDGVENNDKIKDELAKQQNIPLIRIPCDYRNLEDRANVMKNALHSALSLYFDLSEVDWGKCNENAISSLVMSVIDSYNSKDHTRFRKDIIRELSDEFSLCCDTIRKHLIIGNDAGNVILN